MDVSMADRPRIITALVLACSAWLACAAQSANPGPEELRYSKVITLDTTPAGANVPEDVTNYPLAVLLDRTRFDFEQAQPSGADIRFYDATGKPLPHAIELWDRAAGKAAVWVLLDRVKGASKDQSIVMRWGSSRAVDASNSQAVFSTKNGFVGVWHLDEDGNTTPDGYRDASDHQAHGTGVGMVPGSRVDARVGKGVHLDNPKGQETPRWIRVSGEKTTRFNPGGPITASIWALGYSYPIRSYETMIAKGDTSWTLQRVNYSSGQGYQSCVRVPAYHLCAYNFAGQGLVTRQWLHFMVVLEEPVMKIYINGQLNASQEAGPWNKGTHDLGIGNQTQNLNGRRQWDGILDEARVMRAARGPGWAKLDYESQRESPTLLKFAETQKR
jgi:biopolymer transport protein ExbB